MALVACNVVNETANEVAREAAKKTVNEVLFTRFDAATSANLIPFTDCVIDNASALEINSLAQDAVAGVDGETVGLVTDIVRRPDTLTCTAEAGIARALS
ncbi:hypothetical protein [Thalassococcus sp. S3]|uniref:hypothetical protein n=1 Tax=Thalassococcus sp. S3 TaxID=2017482 RepID=UPI00102BC29C|nr:hypothetical protein [Thalassococcus sp. S3]